PFALMLLFSLILMRPPPRSPFLPYTTLFRSHDFESGEFYALVLFTAAGMMMVVHATHLLMLLIGIETMSLAAYVLTGCWRRNPRDRKSTRLNSSHRTISYAVFCLKKKNRIPV